MCRIKVPEFVGFLEGIAILRRTAFLCLAATLGLLACGCGASLNDGSPMAVSPSPANLMTSSSGARTDAIPAAQIERDVTTLTEGSDPSSAAYKIGPLDVVEVSVFQVPDLSRTVQVASDGTINFPLIGEVHAAGRTARDVEHDLAQRLGRKYLQSPQVNVYIREYNSQRVVIDGAVKKPGVFPVRGPTTLLQMIATAEGFTETADSTVMIFREVDGKRTAAQFDVGAIRSGKSKDPRIIEGDAIVVSDSTLKQTYQSVLRVLPLGGIFVSLL